MSQIPEAVGLTEKTVTEPENWTTGTIVTEWRFVSGVSRAARLDESPGAENDDEVRRNRREGISLRMQNGLRNATR